MLKEGVKAPLAQFAMKEDYHHLKTYGMTVGAT